MINQPPSNQSPDLPEFTELLDIDLLDSESLTDRAIELSDEQIDRAVQLSQPIPHPSQQWQTYLHGLALVGFEQWLEEWTPDLEIDESNCSIFQPPYANLIDAVCHIRVGQCNLCLIAIPAMINPTIEIPKAIVDLSQFVPHVYVLIEVKEEQMQVQLYGYLRRDQLIQYSQNSPLDTDASWIYAIPLHWFNADPSGLLIELRHLDAESLPSSVTSKPPLQTKQSLQSRLHSLLPQLRSPDCSLSQILTWEEGAMLLSNPELIRWIYQVQKEDADLPLSPSSPSPSFPLSLSSAKDLNSQPLNVGHWLNDRLDDIAQQLGWILLPPLAAALRSAQELEFLGVQIPPEARGAYQDLQLGNTALRLHAFAWMLSSSIDTLQWTLLIILGTQPQTHLSTGIRLQVRDQAQLLFEQVLEESAQDSYLYAQVGGDLSDRFWVTIDLSDGTTLSLPPFIFYPDSGGRDEGMRQ